jgi:hypothetical protein
VFKEFISGLKKKEKFLFSEKFYILCDNCFDWSLLIKKKSSNGQKMFFFILWQFSFLTQTHELFSNHFKLELIGGRTFKNFILRKISWSVGQIFFLLQIRHFFQQGSSWALSQKLSHYLRLLDGKWCESRHFVRNVPKTRHWSFPIWFFVLPAWPCWPN